MGSYFQGSYDVGRPRMRIWEKLKQLNTKLEGLKFDNIEDGWNNFRKIIFEAADGILRKTVRNAARNITENALF